MNISESEALEIAKNFAIDEYKETKFTLNLGEHNIKLEKGGLGHTHFGLNEYYWSVMFMLENDEGDIAVFDPNHIIILVDAESGKPAWFPAM